MEPRPKIDVPQTPVDKASELLAWAALVVLWALTIWSLVQLPALIPIHFNGAGTPDRYGEKGALLALALVATGLFAGMTAITSSVSKHPHTLNYPITITPANALGQYRGAIRVARGLRIGTVFVFVLLVFRIGLTATGQATGLGAWFPPVTLGLLLALPGLGYWSAVAKAQY